MTSTPENPRDERIEPVADWSRPAPGREPHEPRAQSAPAAATFPVPAWRTIAHWRWAALLVALLVVVLVVFRTPIADRVWPESHVQRLLTEADLALAEGRLTAADGSGARQGFEAALALDSDRSEAREGLRRVGNAALLQSSAALRAGRLDEARAALALARELQVPAAATDAMAEALRLSAMGNDLQSEGTVLLQRARRAHQEGRLYGNEEAALPLYQRLLALEPQLTPALEGREDALTDLLQQARGELQAGRPDVAAALIERARHFDAGHVDLPSTQAELARALEARRVGADALLARGRLDAAAAAYRQLIEAMPGDAAAVQGLRRVAARHAAQSQKHAADFEFDAAEAQLKKARDLAPEAAEVAQAQDAIARARRSQSRLTTTPPRQQREARLKVLLADMRAAEARGHWLTPPGESAFDKLRAAQALWPEHASVTRATTRLVPATRACFEDELRGNRIARARACYDGWQALDPGSRGLADARQRLAQKWIAVGTERLGAGDVAFAVRALQEARELDGNAPGLEEFAARVGSARASAP